MPITAEQEDLRNQLLAPDLTDSQQELRESLLGVRRPAGQDEVVKDLPYAIQDGVYLEDLLNSESRELFKQRLSVSSDPNFIRDKHVASLKLARDNNISFEAAYTMFDDYAKAKYEGNSKAAAADLKKQLGDSAVFSRRMTPREIEEEQVMERRYEIERDPIKAFPQEFNGLYKPLNSKEWEQVRGKKRKPVIPLSGDAFYSPVPKGFYRKSKIEQIALTMDARAKLLPDDDPLKEKYNKWKSVIELRMSLLAVPFEEVEAREKGGIFTESTRGAISGLIDIAGRGLELYGREAAHLGVFDPETTEEVGKALKKFAQIKPLAPPEGDSYAYQMGRVSAQLGAGFAAFFATGNPYAFGVPIGILEYSNTREEVLAVGGTEDQAELAATGVALINMAIEQWQFITIRGFASKGVKDAIRKRATNFTIKNALAFTGAVTLDSAKLLATGGFQEGMQSVVSGGAVAIFDPSSARNIPKQALMEGWYGAGAELLFGGLGRVYTNAQTARQNAQTRKALVTLDKALIEDTGIAPARATEIVNNAMDLAAKTTDKDEGAKIFLDSVNDQLGTQEVAEQVDEKSVAQEIAETERFEVVVQPEAKGEIAEYEKELDHTRQQIRPLEEKRLTEERAIREKFKGQPNAKISIKKAIHQASKAGEILTTEEKSQYDELTKRIGDLKTKIDNVQYGTPFEREIRKQKAIDDYKAKIKADPRLESNGHLSGEYLTQLDVWAEQNNLEISEYTSAGGSSQYITVSKINADKTRSELVKIRLSDHIYGQQSASMFAPPNIDIQTDNIHTDIVKEFEENLNDYFVDEDGITKFLPSPTSAATTPETIVGQAVKSQAEGGEVTPKLSDQTYQDKIDSLPENSTSDDHLRVYRNHVEENGQAITSTLKNQSNIKDVTGYWGSMTSYYITAENADGDTLTIRLSNHDSPGGSDIYLPAESSPKENVDVALWNVRQEWPSTAPEGIIPSKAAQVKPGAVEGKFQVIDNETGDVLEFDTKAKAEAEVKKLRQEQAGGIEFEKIQWKRKSGEAIETTRGELTRELNRLTTDLNKRIADNKINTDEDVKLAESDWNDINSMREALGYAKGEKPFKIIRAKGQEVKTIKNVKSRIWESIKPKTASNLTTSQVVNAVMEGMEKAARTGYMEGARDVVKNHKNLAGYAKARLKGLTVNNAAVNKLLSAISKPRTASEQVSAMAAIEVIAQRAEHATAVTDLKKTVAFVNKKSGKIMQAGGIRPEFLERIQDVLNSFVFKRPSERKIKGRKQTLQQRVVGLKKHLEGLRSSLDSKYNREFAEELLPTRLVESVEKLGISSLADMTAEEINEINRDITSLLHQNKTKNRLILERIARNAADDLNQMMAESDNVVDKKLIEIGDEVKPKPENTLQKSVAVVGGRFNHDLETLIDTLDGGQFGILHKSIAQNFSDGRRKRDAFFNKLDTFVETEMDKAGITLDDLQELSPAFYRIFKGKKGLQFRDKVLAKIGIAEKHKTHEVVLGGKRFNLTMAEIMSIYMHAQARFNLMSMLKSGVAVKDGVTDVVSQVSNIDITEIEAIDKLVKSNPKALRLTEIAAETYDTIFKNAINQVSVSLKGIEIAKEENYWHIQRYTGGGIAGTEAYRISLLESEGRLQAREGSGNPVRINDFFAQTLADRQAIGEYVGMAQAYRAAKTLLNYRPWRKKMELKGYGDEIKKLGTIIERTEQAGGSDYDVVSGFTGKLLHGLTRSVLGNPIIMASQYVSVHGYFTETDFKYIRALRFLPFQAEVDRYRKNWTRYRTRMDGVVSSIALQELTGSDHALRVLAHKTDYINLIITGIHKVDMMAIAEAGRITEAEMADENLGGKAKKYWDREGINPNTLEFESIEYWEAFNKRADYFVRRTQPMFDKENRSVLTGAETGIARSFVLFRSYIDQPLRIFARNQTALANGRISKKEYAQQTGLILGGLYGYTMLRHILDKLIYKDDDDISDLMLEMMMSPAKLLTFVGYPLTQLSEKVFDVAKGEKESFFTPEFDTVATSFLDSVLKNSAEIATGIGYWLQGEDATFQSGPREGESKASAYIVDGVKGLFIDMLTLIGIPTRTASKMYDGWLKDNEEVFKI